MSEITTRRAGDAPVLVRTDLSSLLSDYTTSQRRCMYSLIYKYLFVYISIFIDNNRLESLEREMASLKGQVSQVLPSSDEDHELNRTFTTKKAPVSQPTSARVMSPSRIPLPITSRKSSADDKPAVPTNEPSNSRPLSSVPIGRSKTFHNNTSPSASSNTSDDASVLRAYKVHLEQILYKDAPPQSDIKIPNYTCIEDVIKANEVFI